MSSKSGDPVIQTVLEQIFQASEIDPSSVWPDNHFHELGLSPETIQNVFMKSARSLGLDFHLQKHISPATPRQMVELLRQMGKSGSARAS